VAAPVVGGRTARTGTGGGYEFRTRTGSVRDPADVCIAVRVSPPPESGLRDTVTNETRFRLAWGGGEPTVRIDVRLADAGPAAR
jgi:hypothetical protein